MFAYYFADLLIGSPVPQRTSVIIDTGSRLVGFPCKGCEHCGDHLDPVFDVSHSSSARWLNCSGSCSWSCVKGHCSYRETYSEGSTISGLWFHDSVRLGDSFNDNPPVRASLGCHTNENKLFYTQRANGIMGLAPSYQGTDKGGQPTFLQDLFRDKRHVDAAVFSICLASWGGRITVGGYDNTYHTALGAADGDSSTPRPGRECTKRRPCTDDGTQWIDMRASHYYFVFPQGLVLGSRTVAEGGRSFGVTVVDSGTTYTYLPGPVFNALTSALAAYCEDPVHGCGAEKDPYLAVGVPGADSQCWRLHSPEEGPRLFPPLRMQFAHGVTVDWPPHGYLHQRGSPGLWCQTFMENNLYQTVLGISWMIHKDIIFDVAGGKLGVAQAKCPEHRKASDPVGEVEAALSAKLSGLQEFISHSGGQSRGLLPALLLAAAALAGSAALFFTSKALRRDVGTELKERRRASL